MTKTRCAYCGAGLAHFVVSFDVRMGDRASPACPDCARDVLDRLAGAARETALVLEDMWGQAT